MSKSEDEAAERAYAWHQPGFKVPDGAPCPTCHDRRAEWIHRETGKQIACPRCNMWPMAPKEVP